MIYTLPSPTAAAPRRRLPCAARYAPLPPPPPSPLHRAVAADICVFKGPFFFLCVFKYPSCPSPSLVFAYLNTPAALPARTMSAVTPLFPLASFGGGGVWSERGAYEMKG